MKYAYIDAKSSQVLGWLDTEAYNYAELPASEQLIQLTDQEFAQLQGQNCIVVGGTVRVNDQPSPEHVWDKKTCDWVLDKNKQAELDKQAEQQSVYAVKHALQAHIDSVAVGLGFSGGNAVMLYAGFANAFQSLAQAFGAWEADIWVQANQYMAQVKSGDAPMLMPEQAVERVPSFEFAGA